MRKLFLLSLLVLFSTLLFAQADNSSLSVGYQHAGIRTAGVLDTSVLNTNERFQCFIIQNNGIPWYGEVSSDPPYGRSGVYDFDANQMILTWTNPSGTIISSKRDVLQVFYDSNGKVVCYEVQVNSSQSVIWLDVNHSTLPSGFN